MKILFLTRSLDRGGAERQLVELAKGLHHRGHQVSVGVFYENGALQSELHEAGVSVRVLDKKGRWDVVGFLVRLARWVREERPDILHGYLSLPNVLTLFLKFLVPKARSVWGIRSAFLDLSRYDRLTRFSYALERWLASFADLIIVNSRAGMDYATGLGFPAQRMIVIPNGINDERFRPNLAFRDQVRKEWALGEEVILIGLSGRMDPAKDHTTFLRAAALLSRMHSNLRFVCIGDGPLTTRNELLSLSERLGLGERVIWAGLRTDMPEIYNALDILVSSSIGEGFSNVIGEAMACGRPCVVTDVGDSAWIVGDLGVVVPPSQPEQLADGMASCLTAIKDGKSVASPEKIRQRIVDNFSRHRLIERSEQELERLCRKK